MRLLVCAALMTCFSFGIYAQEETEVINIEFSGIVRHFETNQKLADVTIDVKKDGSVANSISTSSNGKYVSPLELGHVYTIIYSKPGFVSKRIEINTRNVPEDMLYKVNDIFVEMTLFETIEDLDFSLLDKPIGKSKYDPESKEITWDFDYTNSVQHKIAALLDAYERKKEEQARKEAEYNAAMREGDNAMMSKDFDDARKAYNRAQSAKPNDPAVKERLAALDKAVQKQKEQEAEAAARETANAEAAAKQKAYEDAIAKGDKLYAGKEYQQAIAAYEKALEIKSDEGYPKDQIAAATQKIKDLEAEEAKRTAYNKVIKEADDLLASKDLEGAIAKYQEASGMMPNETYPKDKIAEINEKQKALANAEAAKKAEEERKAKLEADYKAQIAKADEAFNSKSWNDAKSAYQVALNLKPDEAYPKEQIARAEEELNQMAALEERYKNAIDEADGLFKNEKWEDAKAAYNKALQIRNEAYPKDQIAAIDKKLAEMANAEAEAKRKAEQGAKAKEAAYKAAVKKGDDLFGAKQWGEARVAYEEALKLKADESYPKDQIAKIEAQMKELAVQEQEYNKVIKEADDLFQAEKWVDAKTAYNKALAIKKETYPKDQIVAIDKKLGEMAEAKRKAEEEAKAKEAAYLAAVKKGDELFAAKEWIESRSAYEEALKLKPEEAYPKTQVEKIEAELSKMAEKDKKYADAIKAADALFNKEQWEAAKAAYGQALRLKDDQYPKDQIAKIENKLSDIATAEEAAKKKAEEEKAAIEKAYADAVKAGDVAFKAAEWEKSKEAYNEALKIKAKEVYPKEQLDKIEVELAKVAEKNKKYEDAVKAADALFAKDQWEAAKAAYGQALRIKEDQYPKDQIAKIEQKMADLAAEKTKAENKAREAAAAREKAYADAVKAGDVAYDAGEWKKSKDTYTKALSIKPDAAHPKQRLADINKKLGDIAANEERYNEAIREADKLFEKKEWEGAVTGYRNALSFKQDPYPKEQISKIEGIMKDEKMQAEKEKMNERYNNIIAEADKLLSGNQLDAAATKYKEALTVKSSEQYPKDKLSEIERKKKQLANEEAAQKEKELRYNEIIVKADAAFGEQKYEQAKELYRDALNIFANNPHPKNRIMEIDAKLADIQKQQQEEERRKAAAAIQAQKEAEARRKQELQQKQDKYNSHIAEAEKALREDKLEDAKGHFQKALDVMPAKAYPKQKILEIDNMMAQREREKQEEERKRQEALKLKEQREEQGEKTGFKVKNTNTTEEQKDKKIESKYSKKHNEKKPTKIKF